MPNANGTPVPVWDQPRDGPSPPRLSPQEWRLRNDTSLARKVAEIEKACSDSTEAARRLPKTLRELRGRNVPELRQWQWSGREIDDKNGRNAAIIARLHAAWNTLAEAEAKASIQPQKVRQSDLRGKLEAALEAVDALEAQVIRLLRERNERAPISDDDRY